jgi:ribosomal protein L18
VQAAKAAEAARKKQQKGGGAVRVPDSAADEDDILAISAVRPRFSLRRVTSHAIAQAIDAANGRVAGGAAAPSARAVVNPWENERRDALKEALKAKVWALEAPLSLHRLFTEVSLHYLQIAAARPKPNPKKK